MNYSTLKKTVALTFVAALAIGAANAQTATGTSTAKVFGGRDQYNTWSIGVNVGATSPVVVTGGVNDYTKYSIRGGAGLSLRDQLSHSYAVQFDVQGGVVAGNNGAGREGLLQYSTNYFNFTLSSVVNVATIDFIRRKNAVNFYFNGGLGYSLYKPTTTNLQGIKATPKSTLGAAVLPIGAGAKFKLTDQLSLNLGYTENFFDTDFFDGNNRGYPTRDKFGYSYAGLEYTLGAKSKPSLEWVNPVAMMYDELYDAALRAEVAALKGRVTNVENAVNDLKKDSDGDGVSDQFDKCPNTPAGTVVDGSGCEIHFPKFDTTGLMHTPKMGAPMASPFTNIQFDFDSSVLRTSSYPVLDASSADLRSGSATVELDGFASSEGTAAHNMRLSKDRANAVKTYLVNSGVDAKRIKVKGFGETKPIADNSTEEGRIANRRVEFKK